MFCFRGIGDCVASQQARRARALHPGWHVQDRARGRQLCRELGVWTTECALPGTKRGE